MLIALVAPCLAAPPPPVPSATADRVAELSLSRVDAGEAWTVRDGRAHDVDAKTWAILTGDAAVLAQIEASRRKGRGVGWGLLAGGGVVAATSMIPLFLLEESLDANESTPAFDELGTRNDARVGAAFSLIGAGVLLAGTGFVAHAVADHRALDLSRHLDPAAADVAITAYNTRLIETLTLAPPEEIEELEEPTEPVELEEPVEIEAPVKIEAPEDLEEP